MKNTKNEKETENNNKDNSKRLKFLSDGTKLRMQRQKNFDNKLKYSEIVRSRQLLSENNEQNDNKEENNNQDENKNTTKLPKITLFNKNEKKVLVNILPQKELEKFEKRFEFIDKEKNNLKRKYALETKNLEDEKNGMEKKKNILKVN